jgi:hypothetical protein
MARRAGVQQRKSCFQNLKSVTDVIGHNRERCHRVIPQTCKNIIFNIVNYVALDKNILYRYIKSMEIQYISLAITIFFGILGVIIVFVTLNKPKLKFYQIIPGKAFTEKANNFANLTIKYKRKKIEGEIVFLQILINNEGNYDIDSKDIYEPLTIKYKNPFIILDAFVNENKINIEINNESNAIFLKWDLLKKNEYILVNIVLKISEDFNLINNKDLLTEYTEICSRIKNIHKIKKEYYSKIISNKEKIYKIFDISILFIFLLFLSFALMQRDHIYEISISVLDNSISMNHYLLDINKRLISAIGNNNEIDVHSQINEIIELMEQENNRISDMNTQIDTNINDSIKISIFHLRGIPLFVFIFSIIVFIIDAYIIIQYIKTRNIEKYLKQECTAHNKR